MRRRHFARTKGRRRINYSFAELANFDVNAVQYRIRTKKRGVWTVWLSMYGFIYQFYSITSQVFPKHDRKFPKKFDNLLFFFPWGCSAAGIWTSCFSLWSWTEALSMTVTWNTLAVPVTVYWEGDILESLGLGFLWQVVSGGSVAMMIIHQRCRFLYKTALTLCVFLNPEYNFCLLHCSLIFLPRC